MAFHPTHRILRLPQPEPINLLLLLPLPKWMEVPLPYDSFFPAGLPEEHSTAFGALLHGLHFGLRQRRASLPRLRLGAKHRVAGFRRTSTAFRRWSTNSGPANQHGTQKRGSHSSRGLNLSSFRLYVHLQGRNGPKNVQMLEEQVFVVVCST